MNILEVQLRNFRNYENESVRFNPGMNIITGENAQGKTNLLESIVYLSLTRSHRLHTDTQLIRNGCEFAKISCLMEDEKDRRKLEAVIHDHGKTLAMNGVILKRSSEFIGKLNVVLFSPDDLGIFTDSPRERRKLMNQEITKISSKYLASLNKYGALLKDRNQLLKNQKIDLNYLDILDEQMIEVSESVIRSRRKFIEIINRYIGDYYRKLSDDSILAQIEYQCCIDQEGNIHEELENLYKNQRNKDIEYHITNSGIHREDIIFKLDGKNVVFTASQGQKRMVMMAFKLGVRDFIYQVTGKKTIMLLDDVLSELDQIRQRKLIELVSNDCQCIITTTDIPPLLKMKNYSEFRVKNGTIEMTGGRR